MPISAGALGLKLVAMLAGAAVVAAVARRVVGNEFIERQAQRIDGINVILLFVFVVAVMDGVAANAITQPTLVLGVTVLAFAPLDLSVELGCPGQFDNPVFLKAVERFERATTAAKVPRSTLALTEQQVQSAIARGYATVGLGFDVLMLKNAATVAIGWARQTAI